MKLPKVSLRGYKNVFQAHFLPIFNSVALLCSEKLTTIGLKIRVFHQRQKTLDHFDVNF